MKRLFFDIETSQGLYLSWSSGKVFIPPENVVEEPRIICICWKWEGDDTLHDLTWDMQRNDKKMLLKFMGILTKADEVVAHNGEHFDIRWLRAQCMYHGIAMPPEVTTLDTLLTSRRGLRLDSYRLAQLARRHKLPAKKALPSNTWRKVFLDNDREALQEMVDYCKQDVVVLENYYKLLIPYILPVSHAGVLSGGEKHHCPRCASKYVALRKTRTTAMGTLRYQLQCAECQTYFTVSSATARKARLV